MTIPIKRAKTYTTYILTIRFLNTWLQPYFMGETLIVYHPRYLSKASEDSLDFNHIDLTEAIKKAFEGSGIKLVFTKGLDFYEKLHEIAQKDQVYLLFTDHYAHPDMLSEKNFRFAEKGITNIQEYPTFVIRTNSIFNVPKHAIELYPSEINSLPERVGKLYSERKVNVA